MMAWAMSEGLDKLGCAVVWAAVLVCSVAPAWYHR